MTVAVSNLDTSNDNQLVQNFDLNANNEHKIASNVLNCEVEKNVMNNIA